MVMQVACRCDKEVCDGVAKGGYNNDVNGLLTLRFRNLWSRRSVASEGGICAKGGMRCQRQPSLADSGAMRARGRS